MINESICSYSAKRDDVLISYLYGEIDDDARVAFDRHLLSCAICRSELQALGGVRTELSRWTSPELTGHVAIGAAPVAPPPRSVWTTMREIPVWAQAAAAVLVLGVSAGLANLEVAYGTDGLTVRTGWRHQAVSAPPAAAVVPSIQPVLSPAPWQAEVSALQQQVEAVVRSRSASTADADAVARRVNSLIQESERRQQREMALRLAELVRDFQSQRQADLVRIDRSLGVIQSRTGMEVMRTQRQVNSLAQQVSQRP